MVRSLFNYKNVKFIVFLLLVPPYAGVVEVVLCLQTKTLESLLVVLSIDLNLVRRIRHAANDARTPVAH